MMKIKKQLGKTLSFVLTFFLAVPSFALAQNSSHPLLQGSGQIAQSQASLTAPEIESLHSVYRREQFSLQYYGSFSSSFGEEERLLFKKVQEENQMHIHHLQDFYTDRSLQEPEQIPERDPFYLSLLQRQQGLHDAVNASIELERREIEELTRQIHSILDQELKNFLSFLRIESYLHLCELFIFSELNQIPVRMNPGEGESCRSITALQPIPKEELPKPSSEPQSNVNSVQVASVSSQILAQYQTGNYFDYGSAYEGFGYRYLTPYGNYGGYPYGGYPSGGYPGYGGYSGGYPSYGGYPQGGYPGYGGYPNYGGYPGGSYGGYPYGGYPQGGGGYYPYGGYPNYSGQSGGYFFDFNFYFHQGYDRGRCYSCQQFPYGGGRY